MSNSCLSCGIPLVAENARGRYCTHCTDESGQLLPKEFIRQGIANWLAGWAPDETTDESIFQQRAEHYLKAMPAWAE